MFTFTQNKTQPMRDVLKILIDAKKLISKERPLYYHAGPSWQLASGFLYWALQRPDSPLLTLPASVKGVIFVSLLMPQIEFCCY